MRGLQKWSNRYARAGNDWVVLCRRDRERTSAEVTIWTDHLRAMRSVQDKLKASGRWRGGPRTLLAAIGTQDRELALTAGLAWLLRPDGHHGLGTAMLAGLLARLGVEGRIDSVRIILEETRGDDEASGLERKTRADLVIYGSGWTIICEAKTYAPEQDRQLDRLYHHWQREAAPKFVFLTRGAREPVSATSSRAHWQQVTWREVAQLARAVAAESRKPAAGVHDYTETLEAYHHV